jgi:hypothetical protein
MAYIGKEPIVGNFQKCDAITVVNGQAAYTLQVSSTNVVPESANHMLVSLNGILQAPVTSFTVSGSTLTFDSNLATGDVIDFVILLGNVLDLGTPSDGTVTNAKLAQDIISGETALTVSPDTTDEVLISNAGTLNRADISVLGNSPAFHVRLSGNQTLSHDTLTRITWDTEVFDTASAFASNVFTVPSNEAGKYLFNFCVFGDDSDDTDTYSAYIEVDGTQNADSQMSLASSKSSLNMLLRATTIITLTAGQVVEVVAKHQGTSASEDVRSSGSFFSGYKLIGV